jgi:hypothetical protein
MTGRWCHRIGTVLAAISLAVGLAAVPAQAAPNALYDGQSVTYFDIVVNKPLFGSNCVGPPGGPTAGSVYAISTGKIYDCIQVTGSQLPDGPLLVHGNGCQES